MSIIQRSDFINLIDLPTNLPDSRLNIAIKEAEEFDICGLLGNAFYYDTISDPITQAKTDLINGDTYNTNYTNPGLKPVAVFFSGARLIRGLDLHITPHGMMYKKNEFSDHADFKAIGAKATEYENRALAYWKKVEDFINFSGKEVYPLFSNFTNCGGSTILGRPSVIGVTGRRLETYGRSR